MKKKCKHDWVTERHWNFYECSYCHEVKPKKKKVSIKCYAIKLKNNIVKTDGLYWVGSKRELLRKNDESLFLGDELIRVEIREI